MSVRKVLLYLAVIIAALILLLFLMTEAASAGGWIQESSGGFGDTNNMIGMCSAVYRGALYVGTYNPVSGAEVWSWDGSVWAQVIGGGTAGSITGPGFGTNENQMAFSMAVFAGYLYVGTVNAGGCRIYRFDGFNWEQVVGEGVGGTITGPGFGDTNNESTPSMAVSGAHLYVGTDNWTGCEIYRTDGAEWEPVVGGGAAEPAGFGYGTANPYVSSMAAFGDGLCAGVFNTSGCQVWDYDGNAWTALVGGGASLGPGFGNSSNDDAHSMMVFDGKLYVGTHNNNGCQIWCFDGSEWNVLVGSGASIGSGFGTSNNSYVLSMGVYDSQLYTGTRNPAVGCQVWRFNGSNWSQVVGQDAAGTPGTGPGFGTRDNTGAQTMAVFDSRIYFATENTGGCEVWSTKSATTWYLAEGATDGGYETWVLVQNPNNTAVDITMKFQTGTGEIAGPTDSIPADSRRSYLVNTYVTSFDVSTKVVSSGPDIICERSMYWTPPGETTRVLGHDSIGVIAPATTWYLAEGATAGGYETWVLVQNPNPTPVDVNIRFETDTGPVQGPIDSIAARSRKTYQVGLFVATYDVSTVVTSNTPGGSIICERSVYWTPPGSNTKILGTDSIGAVEPASRWYLAEGASDGGYETWILVQNPNPDDVNVNVKYQTSNGEVQGPIETVFAGSRKSFRVNDKVKDYNVSTSVTSFGGGVVCERSVYWTPPGSSQAVLGHDSIGVRSGQASWYLAEGATKGGFETWILVQNPNTADVTIDLEFQTDSGLVPAPGDPAIIDTIPARSRRSYKVNGWVDSYDVSTKVTSLSGAPIICERSVYWTPPGSNTKILGTDSIGVNL